MSLLAYKVPMPGEQPRNKWTPFVDGISGCHGYRVCLGEDQLVRHLGESIWVVEYKRPIIIYDNHTVVSAVRFDHQLSEWNGSVARQFVINCAAHVLHVFERSHPNDPRPRTAIDMAMLYTTGIATRLELLEAKNGAVSAAKTSSGGARHAAWAAAWCAAETLNRDTFRIVTNESTNAAAFVAADTLIRPKHLQSWEVAREVEHQWQATMLRNMLGYK